jgi:hypothetical protein
MRAREMWVHAVDLDIGASFADLPPPMLTELLSDVAAAMGEKPDSPALLLVAPGGAEWSVGDRAGAVTIWDRRRSWARGCWAGARAASCAPTVPASSRRCRAGSRSALNNSALLRDARSCSGPAEEFLREMPGGPGP